MSIGSKRAARSALANSGESEATKRQAREYLANCERGCVDSTPSSNIFWQYGDAAYRGVAGSLRISEINRQYAQSNNGAGCLALDQASRRVQDIEASSCSCLVM